LFPNGKTRLIPVAILADGQYYDASLYQASPVPMALYSGTVYEGFRNGVSQGLFTVKDALSSPNNVWQGEGKWETATELEKKKAQKPSSPIPRDLDEADAPPKLRHGGGSNKSPQSQAATPPAAVTPEAATPKVDDSKPATTAAAPPAQIAPVAPTPTPSTTPPSSDSGPIDANAPQLKRGKSAVPESADDVVRVPRKGEKPVPSAVAISSKTAAKPLASEKSKPTEMFPAISDAHSVESHSYDYPMKAGEEDALRRKMLALADIDVHARDKELSQMQSSPQPTPPAKRKAGSTSSRSAFTDIQLRIVDVSSSNEPTLVLSATATSPSSGRQYMLTLVAHEDVYGDLHKAFGSITDADHLDILPRMELIDAIDVDGDGRGDLLFRQVYDSGTAYVVYRVSGDQLYPLFQGTKS
jgi:hypothetical protein